MVKYLDYINDRLASLSADASLEDPASLTSDADLADIDQIALTYTKRLTPEEARETVRVLNKDRELWGLVIDKLGELIKDRLIKVGHREMIRRCLIVLLWEARIELGRNADDDGLQDRGRWGVPYPLKSHDELCQEVADTNPEPEADDLLNFVNYYYCEACDHRWDDYYVHVCNDRCPICRCEIEPNESLDLRADAKLRAEARAMDMRDAIEGPKEPDEWDPRNFEVKEDKPKPEEPEDPEPRKIDLLDEFQREACETALLEEPGIVLITGPGGTGKSFLVDALKEEAMRRNLFVEVSSSTGVSAVNIGGRTVHSVIGWTPKNSVSGHTMWNSLKNNKYATERINRLRGLTHLLIDEVSMISAKFLDDLDTLLRLARGEEDTPFGGMRIILLGDFLQLPPVSTAGDIDPGEFAFKAKAWKDVRVFHLQKIYRQDDPEFVEILCDLRMGRRSPRLDAFIHECLNRVMPPEAKPVVMFPHKVDVGGYNSAALGQLPYELREFYAKDGGEQWAVAMLDRNCLAPSVLQLKQEARVMLLKNIDPQGGLVNGSLGTVEGFNADNIQVRFDNGLVTYLERQEWEIYKNHRQRVPAVDEEGKTLKDGAGMTIYQEKTVYGQVAKREQFPLALAWAVTVHKSQGMSLDAMLADVSNAFAAGQVYVALSRARNRDRLQLKGVTPACMHPAPEALAFYQALEGQPTPTLTH